MKSIYSLVEDIYETVGNDNRWFNKAISSSFAGKLAGRLEEVNEEGHQNTKPSLRLSQMGPRCPKQLWHSIHTSELAEPVKPWVKIKFTYGHILEAYVIAMAKASGHEVVGEQDELIVDGVKGHRDCVIDGCIVDVKSCSSRMFQKFKDRTIREDDPFGYLDQLDGYVVGSSSDPLVRVKDRGFILAIDKVLGHICIYEHKIREASIRARIREYKTIVGLSNPPKCTCKTIPDGRSGNMQLDTKASYNPFKHVCFPNLRTFLYASGPRYLTVVKRKPDVIEVDKLGNIVYN